MLHSRYHRGQPRALNELHDDGLVGPPRGYASNVLALLVRAGNPTGIVAMKDLARPGLRVALPDPLTEGIGRLALQALSAAADRRSSHRFTIARALPGSLRGRRMWLSCGKPRLTI